MGQKRNDYNNCIKVVKPVEAACPWPRAPEVPCFPPAPVLEPLGRGCWMKLTWVINSEKPDIRCGYTINSRELRNCLERIR